MEDDRIPGNDYARRAVGLERCAVLAFDEEVVLVPMTHDEARLLRSQLDRLHEALVTAEGPRYPEADRNEKLSKRLLQAMLLIDPVLTQFKKRVKAS